VQITDRNLQRKTSKVPKIAQRAVSVSVAPRGKRVVRPLSIKRNTLERDLQDYPAIGMWADRKGMADPAAWGRKGWRLPRLHS